MTPFELAVQRIDAANSEDPNLVMDAGVARPAELLYSQRMTEMLSRFVREPSLALQLAARAQHLRRWTVPRDSYPMNRAGYHRWRGDLKRKHGEWTAEILVASGLDAETTDRVARLIRKENLKTDPESQALEDVACLVFLQYYAADFARKHDSEKVAGILRKTWKKMSEKGHAAALALTLAPEVRVLLDQLSSKTSQSFSQEIKARDTAVILAAHGDRGGASPNATLLGHCERLDRCATFHSVSAGLLRGEPSLEDAIRAAVDGGAKALVVYPMFMAEGYFTQKVLTQRISALEIPIDVLVLPALGGEPELPQLMLDAALAAAGQSGVVPQQARLLIVGHGSKTGPASADATRMVAHAIADFGRFRFVEAAFLEEPEFLSDALARSPGLPTVVSGFFSGDGLHAGEDVPEAIAETGGTAVYAGSIGALVQVTELIRSRIQSVCEGQ